MRAVAQGILWLVLVTPNYQNSYNQAESFRYYHDLEQYQQQQYQIQQGVDLPPPIPVNPPQYLYGIPSAPVFPGGQGGE